MCVSPVAEPSRMLDHRLIAFAASHHTTSSKAGGSSHVESPPPELLTSTAATMKAAESPAMTAHWRRVKFTPPTLATWSRL